MTSEILINGKFAFDKLSALLDETLAGQQISENVDLENITVTADQNWIYAVMGISGRHNGTIIAKFKLRTSDTARELFIEQLNISLDEKGLLAMGANWMLKGFLGDKIESKVQELLSQSLTSMMSNLASKYAVVEVDGISIKSQLQDYKFEEVSWTETHLSCKFYTQGVISVELD